MVVTCGACELAILCERTKTCTVLPGAVVSGTLKSICQTPTIPGARPEYMMLDALTKEGSIHTSGLFVVETWPDAGVPSGGAPVITPGPVPNNEITCPRAIGWLGWFAVPSSLVAINCPVPTPFSVNSAGETGAIGIWLTPSTCPVDCFRTDTSTVPPPGAFVGIRNVIWS